MIRVGQLQLVDPPGQCQTETQAVASLRLSYTRPVDGKAFSIVLSGLSQTLVSDGPANDCGAHAE
jgi:hypothetical protein